MRWGRVSVVGSLALLSATLGIGPPANAEMVPGYNLRVGDDPNPVHTLQNPDVAVNPTNPGNVVVSMEERRGGRCRVATRLDDPSGWTTLQLEPPFGFKFCDTFGPATAVAFDGAGTLYLLFAATNAPNGGGVIFLTRSKDGGATFDRPKLISPVGHAVIEPRIVVDTWDPSGRGAVYVSWTDVTEPSPDMSSINVIASRNGGTTFSAAVRVNGPLHPFVRSPGLAIGTAGELFVAFFDDTKSVGSHACSSSTDRCPATYNNEIVVARSTDGGRSFFINSSVTNTVSYHEWAGVGEDSNTAWQYPSLAVDPRNETVLVVWHEGIRGNTQLFASRSTDEGLSWTAPERVVADPPGISHARFLPRLAVAAAGRMDIVYYQRDPTRMDAFLVSSPDGGVHFEAPLRLSDESFDPRIGPGDVYGKSFGEQLGLGETPKGVVAFWSDSRNGTAATAGQDIFGVEALSL